MLCRVAEFESPSPYAFPTEDRDQEVESESEVRAALAHKMLLNEEIKWLSTQPKGQLEGAPSRLACRKRPAPGVVENTMQRLSAASQSWEESLPGSGSCLCLWKQMV